MPGLHDLSAPLLALPPILLEMVLKGIVILALAAALALGLSRASAAARHLVWLVALLCLIALPVLSAVLPVWHLSVPVPLSAAVARPAVPAGERTPTSVAELPGAGPLDAWKEPGASPDQPTASPLPHTGDQSTRGQSGAEFLPAWAQPWHTSGPAWPLWLWVAGAILACLPIAGGLLSLWRLRRSCRPVAAGPAGELFRQLCARLGLVRPVRLLVSPERSMPMTWGVWRPVILLPCAAENWPVERLRVVLLHELGHVRRWDCLTQVLAHLARALHWFNPLAWLAVARLHAEQERACDDLVLGSGLDAAEYAEHLLAVTSGLSSRFLVTPVAPAIGRRSRMEGRLLSILDSTRARRPLPRRTMVLAWLASLLLLLPLASVHLQPSALVGAAEERAARDTSDQVSDPAKQLTDVRAKIKEFYGKKVDEKKLTESAIRGLVRSLHDPYSAYLSPEQMRELNSQIHGEVSGIGAQLRMHDGKLIVTTPLEDSPALKAGLRPGDVMVAIDGKATQGMSLTDAVHRILGRAGTAVKLKVQHEGGPQEEMEITRGHIKLRTVEGFRRDAEGHWDFLLDSEHQIGYVHLLQFGPTTGREVGTAIKELQAKGLKGLIVDMRFCPGGLLQAAGEVSNLFLAKGDTIVTIKGLKDGEQTYRAEGKTKLGDFPVVVLVNERTASAGEILAGALKDNHRAVVVGTRTYGKGSVQQIVNLDDGGALKLTSSQFYLPSGRYIQKRPGEKTWGVDPDDGYYVPLASEKADAVFKGMQERGILGLKRDEAPKKDLITPQVLRQKYSDPQLAAALETLTAKLTTGSFAKVGKSDAVLQAHLTQREEVQKRRQALLKQLDGINKELADLDKAIKDENKP